jgi:hypothetical protein
MLPRLLALIPLLALVPSCVDEDMHHLDEIDDLHLDISYRDNVVHVELDPSLAGYVDLGPTFAASIAGQTTTEIDHGEIDHDFAFGEVYADIAIDPANPPAHAVLVVSDETLTVEVDLGDRLLPRTMQVVAPADLVIHPGDVIDTVWSPAPIDATYMAFLAADGQSVATLDATIAGDHISATAPSSFPGGINLAYDPTLCVSEIHGADLPCENATCTLEVDTRGCIAATFSRTPR